MKSESEIRRVLAALRAELVARGGCECGACRETCRVFTIAANMLAWALGEDSQGDAAMEWLIRHQAGECTAPPSSN